MRLPIPFALVGLVLMGAPPTGSAQTVSWMIEGRVDSASTGAVDPGFFATFSAGSPVEVLLTHVTAAPEFSWYAGNANVGGYPLSTWGVPPQIDMQAAIGGRGYYQKPGSLVPFYVHRPFSQWHYDGTIPERLGGDNVATAFTWKPWALDFSLSWPGFPFASDALPTTVPHNTPAGGFHLYLRRCANNVADPCPLGLTEAERIAHAYGSWDKITPVITQKIDVEPNDKDNLISWSGKITKVAILGNRRFLPDVVLERSTIKLEGAPAIEGGRSCVATDVDRDGYVDLVCQVYTERLRRRAGSETLQLIARTIDGNYIRGVDTFRSR